MRSSKPKFKSLGEIMRVRSAMTSQCRTQAASGATVLARPLLALILAATLVGGPVSPAYAQAAPQNPPPAPAPQAAPSAVTTPISVGAAIAGSSARLNPFAFIITQYGPLLTSTASVADRTRPINNPYISRTRATGAGAALRATPDFIHTDTFNTQYSQYFPTGTSMTVTYDNTRSSSDPTANFFNPYVQSSIFVSFSQNLLSGFGLTVNRRNIIIANNN